MHYNTTRSGVGIFLEAIIYVLIIIAFIFLLTNPNSSLFLKAGSVVIVAFLTVRVMFESVTGVDVEKESVALTYLFFIRRTIRVRDADFMNYGLRIQTIRITHDGVIPVEFNPFFFYDHMGLINEIFKIVGKNGDAELLGSKIIITSKRKKGIKISMPE